MKKLIIVLFAVSFFSSCKKQTCESLTTFKDSQTAYEVLQEIDFDFDQSHTFLSTELFTTADYKSCNGLDGFLILIDRASNTPYIHQKVPMDIWLGLLKDGRKSNFYNVKIRGKFPLRKAGVDYDVKIPGSLSNKAYQQ